MEQLKANTWNASFAYGSKVEMEECKQFLERTYGSMLKKIEHIDYTEETKEQQQQYGDWKITLYPDKVYYVESKGRARDTDDLCIEVTFYNGKYHMKHKYTDKLFYYTPNHDSMLFDVPTLRTVFYQNIKEWQQYVKQNRKKDGYCMYIPFAEVIPKYNRIMGMIIGLPQ
jgi:hypothetical protein